MGWVGRTQHRDTNFWYLKHNYFTFVSITWYVRNNHFLQRILVQKLLLSLDICSYFLGAKEIWEDGVSGRSACQLPTVRVQAGLLKNKKHHICAISLTSINSILILKSFLYSYIHSLFTK